MSQELDYIPNFSISKLCTLLKKGAIFLISIEFFDFTRYFQMFFLMPNALSRLVILLGNPSYLVYWVCGNYMVAQILCISISSETNYFLISYFSRGCSLSVNLFLGVYLHSSSLKRHLLGCLFFLSRWSEKNQLWFPTGLTKF